MRKIDLNKLFAGLTKKFGVSSYKISHMLNIHELTPHDIVIDAYGRNIKNSDLNKIEKLINKCINGKIIGYAVKVEGNKIHIYIEFKHMYKIKK